MILSRKILSETLWLVCKNFEEALWNEYLLLNGHILFFAFIFLNVLPTLEILHFVLKVGRDYEDRKLEENVVCWHHHVCLISQSHHNLYVYALRHVRVFTSYCKNSFFLYLIVECTQKNEKLTNVALKKKTFQSSTYGGRRRKYYSSAQAVDGLSKTFSMTNKVPRVEPYWYVDLGGIYTIRHIVIFNRPKISGGYFSQFILVSVLTAISISEMKSALNTFWAFFGQNYLCVAGMV